MTRLLFSVEHDLMAMEANAVGELLRAQTFVGEGFGCYHSFEVRPDAQVMSKDDTRDFFAEHHPVDEDDWPYIEPVAGCWRQGELVVAYGWYWDGDGTLIFRVSGLGGSPPLRMVVNTDCKKSNRWEEYERVEI